MGCTHPATREIRDDGGTVVGIRCLACGSTAYAGESIWRQIWRNLFGRRRAVPDRSRP